MRKPNYDYEKRQRDIAKKKKKEEKAQKKRERSGSAPADDPENWTPGPPTAPEEEDEA